MPGAFATAAKAYRIYGGLLPSLVASTGGPLAAFRYGVHRYERANGPLDNRPPLAILRDRFAGRKKTSTPTRRPRSYGKLASPARKRGAGGKRRPVARKIFKKARTGVRPKGSYQTSNKTKRIRMKVKGKRVSRPGAKKNKFTKLRQTITQRYHICKPAALHVKDQGFVGYMTKPELLTSTPAVDALRNSIVVFRIDATERHFNPNKYIVGTQFMPSVGNVIEAEVVPVKQDYFIWENDVKNSGLVPKPGLDFDEFPLRIPYSISAIPDSALANDVLNERYTIPNSILQDIKINMQFTHCLPCMQELTLKLVRNSRPDPVAAGEWTNASEDIDDQLEDDNDIQKILCNRLAETDSKFFSTIWTHTIRMPAIKVGQRRKTHRVNKTISVGYKRSTCRKIIDHTTSKFIGDSVVPTFVIDGALAMYNQVFLVVSSRLIHTNYVAALDVDVTGTQALAKGTHHSEAVPALCKLPLGPLTDPDVASTIPTQYKIGRFAEFEYGGTIGVTHKVRDITRGVNFQIASEMSKVKAELASLQGKLSTHEHDESDSDSEELLCKPELKRHCKITVKDGKTQIGE